MKNKGITLIALVITIIIMLILAGIVLTMTIGTNGIIGKAIFAKNKYENSANEEKNILAQTDSYIVNNRDNTATLRKIIIGEETYTGLQSKTYTYNVSSYPGYHSFTLDNFSIDLTKIYIIGHANTSNNRNTNSISKSYDSENGIFTFTLPIQMVNKATPEVSFNVCLYYME